jgi:hypothetical protein
MDLGEWGGVQEVKPLHPKRSAFFVTQYLSFMQPAPYKTNYCRIKFA